MQETKFINYIKSWGGVGVSIAFFAIGCVAPIWSLKTNIALIQKDIEIINSNHMQHTQDLAQNIKDLEVSEKNILEKLDTQQQAITRLLEMHNR